MIEQSPATPDEIRAQVARLIQDIPRVISDNASTPEGLSEHATQLAKIKLDTESLLDGLASSTRQNTMSDTDKRGLQDAIQKVDTVRAGLKTALETYETASASDSAIPDAIQRIWLAESKRIGALNKNEKNPRKWTSVPTPSQLIARIKTADSYEAYVANLTGQKKGEGDGGVKSAESTASSEKIDIQITEMPLTDITTPLQLLPEQRSKLTGPESDYYLGDRVVVPHSLELTKDESAELLTTEPYFVETSLGTITVNPKTAQFDIDLYDSKIHPGSKRYTKVATTLPGGRPPQMAGDQIGLLGLASISSETPKLQEEYYRLLASTILSLHEKNPGHLKDWIAGQRIHDNFSIKQFKKFDLFKGTDDKPHFKDNDYLNLKYLTDSTDSKVDDEATAKLWEGRRYELANALKAGNLLPHHHRWLEFLGNSIDITALAKKIKATANSASKPKSKAGTDPDKSASTGTQKNFPGRDDFELVGKHTHANTQDIVNLRNVLRQAEQVLNEHGGEQAVRARLSLGEAGQAQTTSAETLRANLKNELSAAVEAERTKMTQTTNALRARRTNLEDMISSKQQRVDYDVAKLKYLNSQSAIARINKWESEISASPPSKNSTGLLRSTFDNFIKGVGNILNESQIRNELQKYLREYAGVERSVIDTLVKGELSVALGSTKGYLSTVLQPPDDSSIDMSPNRSVHDLKKEHDRCESHIGLLNKTLDVYRSLVGELPEQRTSNIVRLLR